MDPHTIQCKNCRERRLQYHSLRVKREEGVAPSLDEITEAVAEEYNLTLSQILGKRRFADVAQARRVAMFLCRAVTGYSLQTLADYFGKRHHSTVVYACQKVKRLLDSNPAFQGRICEIGIDLGYDLKTELNLKGGEHDDEIAVHENLG